ncbi:hypothetical protein HF086_005329 [Spodoptera exigua]|uniref:UBX domain-containing protein n=1 Tax=Spodoptera exigua TaxID=7107 RepID=A0A922SQG7_SPOEX|nr:hypothetical protein HF086_005329 [Spodoptera exigua]
MSSQSTSTNSSNKGHKMPVLVVCYKCKQTVDIKKTALCSICNNRFEPDCDGYPEHTYRLMNQESKNKWRCKMCIRKKTTNPTEPSNITMRKIPRLPVTKTPLQTHTNKKESSPDQDSHVLTDYDASYEIDDTTPNKLSKSVDGTTTIISSVSEMQDTIAQMTIKLESTENELENTILENNDLKKQVNKLTQEINVLKSLCHSSTSKESSPISIDKKKIYSRLSQIVSSTPSSPRLTSNAERNNNFIYLHLQQNISALQKELQSAENEIKNLNTQIQDLKQSLRITPEEQTCSDCEYYDQTYLNPAELRKHLELLELTLLEMRDLHNDPHVMCLSETFIKKGHESYLKLSDYEMATNFCREKHRGGTCILVKKGLRYKELPFIKTHASVNTFEACGIELENQNWFKKQIQMKVHQYICEGASYTNAVIKSPNAPLSKEASTQAMHDVISDCSEYSFEMNKLKKEVERLLCANSALRKEIARLKGEEPPDAGQAFYAGGSERSGQQILGPSKGGRKDIVTEVFKSVRERGAVVFEDEPSSTSRGRSAFSGVGYRLAPVAGDVADRAANQRAAQEAVKVDDSAPVTTIQFRLADGSRLTGRFNHSHTVGDLHAYVSRAEPSYQLQAFALLTTFPSRELADHAATLAQANILNTTLLQRLK